MKLYQTNWSELQLTTITTAENLLQTYFGYEQFRHGKKNAIEYTMNADNTLTVMTTGGGNTICTQIPGLALVGTDINHFTIYSHIQFHTAIRIVTHTV